MLGSMSPMGWRSALCPVRGNVLIKCERGRRMPQTQGWDIAGKQLVGLCYHCALLSHLPPCTPTRSQLCAIWNNILNIVGLEKGFIYRLFLKAITAYERWDHELHRMSSFRQPPPRPIFRWYSVSIWLFRTSWICRVKQRPGATGASTPPLLLPSWCLVSFLNSLGLPFSLSPTPWNNPNSQQ